MDPRNFPREEVMSETEIRRLCQWIQSRVTLADTPDVNHPDIR